MSDERPGVYERAGVNTAEGDSFSALAGQVCRQSWKNNPYVNVRDFSSGRFRGPRGWETHELPEGCIWTAGLDGNGTKPMIVSEAMNHRQAGRDTVTMVADDISRYGGLPLIFLDQLDTSTLGKEGDKTNHAMREVVLGMGEAAAAERLVILGGETAELGLGVGSENPAALTKFLAVGAGIGVYHPMQMILGDSLAPGQSIMALREYGPRCNWISAIRLGLRNQFGDEWFNQPAAKYWIEKAAAPSTSYTTLLATLNGWYRSPTFQPVLKMYAVAHLTGGGIKDKFWGDVLRPRGLSAALTDLWPVPPVLGATMKWTDCSPEEFYAGTGGGQGALVVIDQEDEQRFVDLAASQGRQAKKAGSILARDHGGLMITPPFRAGPVIYTA